MRERKVVKSMANGTKQKTKTIPKFKTIDEEKKFWDTHDLADYWGDFRPVKVSFAKNLSRGITIRLDDRTLNKLRLQARNQGIGPTTLIRMWILERLRESGDRPISSP